MKYLVCQLLFYFVIVGPLVTLAAEHDNHSEGNNIVQKKDLEQRMDELETQMLEDRIEIEKSKIQLGGGFSTRFSDINFRDENAEEDNVQLMNMRLHLDLTAQVNSSTTFYSTFAMKKFFNAYVRQNTGGTRDILRDFSGAYYEYENASIFLDKAYLSLKIVEPLSLSVGRLPTVQGPPIQYYDRGIREGTYPAMSYNQILDGVALNYSLSEYFLWKDQFIIRALYTPIGSYDYVNKVKQTTTLDKKGNEVKRTSYTPFYTIMFDYTSRLKNDLYDEFNFISQYFSVKDTIPPSDSFNNDSLSTLRSDYRQNIGSTTFYLGFKSLFNLPIDFTISHSRSEVEALGDVYNTNSFCGPSPDGTPCGFENDKKLGYSTLISINYVLKNTRFGTEYLNGSEHFILFDGTSENHIDFYSLRGQGIHYYISQGLWRNTFLRLGYIEAQQDYRQGSTSGKMTESTDKKYRSAYLNMRILF